MVRMASICARNQNLGRHHRNPRQKSLEYGSKTLCLNYIWSLEIKLQNVFPLLREDGQMSETSHLGDNASHHILAKQQQGGWVLQNIPFKCILMVWIRPRWQIRVSVCRYMQLVSATGNV